MEGKANISIGQVNNIDKQKVSLSYYIGSFDNVKDAQIAKFAFDKVAEELGATVQDEACILGEVETNEAKEEAEDFIPKSETVNPVPVIDTTLAPTTSGTESPITTPVTQA